MRDWLKIIDWAAIFGGALVLVLLMIATGSLTPPQPPEQRPIQASEQQYHADSDGKCAAFFAGIGCWIGRNHKEIEAGSAFSIALLTAGLVGSTIGLWIATRGIVTDARIGRERTERAYLEMSHKPPGLDIKIADGFAVVRVQIKNTGRTPARVSNVLLKMAVGSLPTNSDTTVPASHKPIRSFLVTQGTFVVAQTFERSPKTLTEIRDEKTPCWIYGHVDYIDVFGIRQRGGYMRKFDRFDNSVAPTSSGTPVERDNNLIFDDAPGYNYDEPRVCGQGHDWDET